MAGPLLHSQPIDRGLHSPVATDAPLVEVFNAHRIDAAAFVWAHQVLMSRMISFALADGSTLHVVGPGVDMFNHSIDAPVGNEDVRLEPPGSAVVPTSARRLAVRASCGLAAGEQAFFSYSCGRPGAEPTAGGPDSAARRAASAAAPWPHGRIRRCALPPPSR
eukprot:863325-Prymnesium_polylepis.1